MILAWDHGPAHRGDHTISSDRESPEAVSLFTWREKEGDIHCLDMFLSYVKSQAEHEMLKAILGQTHLDINADFTKGPLDALEEMIYFSEF